MLELDLCRNIKHAEQVSEHMLFFLQEQNPSQTVQWLIKIFFLHLMVLFRY